MTSETVPLHSLCEVITKGTTPTQEQGYQTDGINFIRALSINDEGNLDEETFLKIDEETNLFLNRSILCEGDVLLSIAGAIGRVAVVKSDYLPANVNQALAIIRPKKNLLSSRYLANLLRSHNSQHYFMSRIVDSVQANLSLTEIRNFPVEQLSMKEQEKRCRSLNLIDEHSESARLMNNVISQSISVLFRSWFIDFDPVRAKAKGELPYGMDEETAALFPDSFENSELGPIPAGWEIEAIDDVCEFVSRGVTPEYEISSGRWIINQKVNKGEVFDIGEMKELSPSLHVPKEKFARKYDVLVNCLGEGTLGRVHFYSGKSGLYAVDQHMSICRANSDSLAVYLYSTLASPIGQYRIENSKTGSTGMTMFNISKLRRFKIYLPPQEILEEFGRIAIQLICKKQQGLEQIQFITETRDVLFPRLMSGELQVPTEA